MDPSSPSVTMVFDDLLQMQDIFIVTLVGARDLVPKDRNDLSDPYVITTYSGFSHKSSVKKETLNPQWNETISIPLNDSDIALDASIYFKVMDKDLVNDFEGDFTLKFKDIPNLDGIPFDCKLQDIEKGILTIACQVKFFSRSSISQLNLPSSIQNRECFYKTTRNSWLLGCVKYPMSRFEIEKSIKNSSFMGNSNESPRSPRNTPIPREIKWQQVHSSSETLLEILTEAESYYGFTGGSVLVDRVRVELVLSQQVVKDETAPLSLVFEKHLQQHVLKKNTFSKTCSWKNVTKEESILFSNTCSTTATTEQQKSGTLITSMQYLKSFSGEFEKRNGVALNDIQNSTTVCGKAYVIPIGHCSMLSLTYLSNCGMPFDSSFDEMVHRCMPPSRNTLFSPLHCDIHDSLWLKWPCGWDYEETSMHLLSPIHTSGNGTDRFMATRMTRKLSTLSSSTSSNPVISQKHILYQLALEHLQELQQSSDFRNVKIRKDLQHVERQNSSGTPLDKSIRDFVEFEIEYMLNNKTSNEEKDVTLYRICSVLNTYGENCWVLGYESSSNHFPNRDVFECVLGQIKYDEMKKQELLE
nr:unnamed protein product [Naegleria fowleri]